MGEPKVRRTLAITILLIISILIAIFSISSQMIGILSYFEYKSKFTLDEIWDGTIKDAKIPRNTHREYIGKLGIGEFPNSDNTGTVKVLTLELNETNTYYAIDTIYLLSDYHKPIIIPDDIQDPIDKKSIPELIEAELVFIHGYIVTLSENSSIHLLDVRYVKSVGVGQLPDLAQTAKAHIIDKVGEEYFNRHFYYRSITECVTESWRYCVSYYYYPQTVDYAEITNVHVYYDENKSHLWTNFMPSVSNKMPFKVNQQDAIDIVMKTFGFKIQPYMGANLYHWKKYSNGMPLGKYVWVMQIFLSPEDARSGSIMEVLIDPNTGYIIDICPMSWSTS